ncbi:uncharacterized protein LOC106070359 isoform X1 [Biomphalaria glabrata]|uniref:Uncharacterized protein LOC106070359 isoform X1 n=2 Tax=Biomphalaria glabrata TaxID=6526 RepID=A0A9W2YJU7_BIOGL|nr:uncharacterized protein LOC106070359 isoform X1 [Biomphalaria glabrata]
MVMRFLFRSLDDRKVKKLSLKMATVLLLIVVLCAVSGSPTSVSQKTKPPEPQQFSTSVEDAHPRTTPLGAALSRIISSMVDKGPTKSGDDVLGLPDDIVFDALMGNINTLQEQIELCEEELIEKVGNTRTQGHGHHPDDRSGRETETPSRHHHGDTQDDPENNDGDDAEEKNKAPHALSRRIRSSALKPAVKIQVESHDSFVRDLVNRLSSRLEYLKVSLSQCYDLFKVWNKKQTLKY